MGDLNYSDKVMDHFLHPRNVGEIPDASGIGNVGNPVCGDVMRMYIKVENGVIVDAKFKTFGCLPPNEKIVLSKGGWEGIAKLSIGAMVVNNSGKRTRVVETYQRDYAGELLHIIPFVSPFNSFSVTPAHPVLCIRRKWVKGARRSWSKSRWLQLREENIFSAKTEYVSAAELSGGDYLVFNVLREVRDNELFTEEMMRLMGYYLAEGYIAAQGGVVAFAFNKNEREFIKEVKYLLLKVAGKEAKSRMRGSCVEVYVCSRKLALFLTQSCKKIAKNKSLAEEILLLPFEKQWELIETYMRGDGDSYRRRPHNSRTYRIITTSESLAIQMQEMLARGGIFASIRQLCKTDCYIGDRRLKDSLQYLLSFKRVSDHRFVHYNGKYFLVPIKKIERKDFRGRVYNVQVAEEPNSYLIKGFAVHNCGAAISTSSMVTEMVKGKTIEEALKISNKAVAEALGGLPQVKLHCSVLAEQALRAALADYYKRIGKDPAAFGPTKDTHEEHGH